MSPINRLPVRLETVPLFEATFELRFRPTREDAVDLLPGILFSALGDRYGRSEATPLASLPRAIRSQDSKLWYQAHYRLLGENGGVFVGDRVAGLNHGPPYDGWSTFLPQIEALLEVISRNEIIEHLERYSMKFTNVLMGEPGRRLDLLDFEVELADYELAEAGMSFRTELKDDRLIRIIEIVPAATINNPRTKPIDGLLLSLDCINPSPEDGFLTSPQAGLEEVHTELKSLFFSIITNDTLESLGPEYDD